MDPAGKTGGGGTGGGRIIGGRGKPPGGAGGGMLGGTGGGLGKPPAGGGRAPGGTGGGAIGGPASVEPDLNARFNEYTLASSSQCEKNLPSLLSTSRLGILNAMTSYGSTANKRY